MFKYSYLVFSAILGSLVTAAVFSSFWIGNNYGQGDHQNTWSGRTSTHSWESVHFHANFAVYSGTGFVDFCGETYMEELQSCTKGILEQLPRDRAHQHERKGGLIHVHAPAVTWGHFFSNIGWNFGTTFLVDRGGKVFENTPKMRVRYVLGDVLIPNPFNRPIKSEERLLIDYSWATDAEVVSRAKDIPSTAKKANSTPDPSSCSGHS